MTLEEIYAELSAHMIKGMMIHAQMADYYDFLGLEGYKRCHEYHFMMETCNMRSIHRYFLNHHNKLIKEQRIEDPRVIPDSWYNYKRQDVSTTTKQTGVKNGLTMWVDWERETKKLYERMYKELMDLNEVASAFKIKELICDVDKELKKAERYQLNKEATDYDIKSIIGEQRAKHNKYKRKMEKDIKVVIC